MATKNAKFEQLANEVVGLVGGKDNITWLTHCVTRLRFNVKDRSLVQKATIEKLPGTMGSQWQGDQYQVIIGPAVHDAYLMVCEKNDIAPQDAVDENLDAASGAGAPKGKKSVKDAVMSCIAAISGCIAPLIPMLSAVGMVKVVLVLLTQFGLMAADNPTYVMLDFVSDAGLMFLPVAVGASAAKKFGGDMFIGVMLGAALIHPTFTAMVEAGDPTNIFGLPVTLVGYTYSIFPMILTMYVASKLQKFLDRVVPATVRLVFVPLAVVLVMTPILFCVLGPLGTFMGNYLSAGVMWIYERCGFLAIAILAAIEPLVIMTGMHLAFDPITLNNFATVGFDPIMGIIQIVHNVGEGAVALGVAIRSKHDKALRAEGISCAITAIIGGITEPTIFGFTLRYKGIMGVLRYAYGGSNVLGLAVFVGPDPMNLVHCIISFVIGFAVTLVATVILYKPETVGETDDASAEPVSGTMVGVA